MKGFSSILALAPLFAATLAKPPGPPQDRVPESLRSSISELIATTLVVVTFSPSTTDPGSWSPSRSTTTSESVAPSSSSSVSAWTITTFSIVTLSPSTSASTSSPSTTSSTTTPTTTTTTTTPLSQSSSSTSTTTAATTSESLEYLIHTNNWFPGVNVPMRLNYDLPRDYVTSDCQHGAMGSPHRTYMMTVPNDRKYNKQCGRGFLDNLRGFHIECPEQSLWRCLYEDPADPESPAVYSFGVGTTCTFRLVREAFQRSHGGEYMDRWNATADGSWECSDRPI